MPDKDGVKVAHDVRATCLHWGTVRQYSTVLWRGAQTSFGKRIEAARSFFRTQNSYEPGLSSVVRRSWHHSLLVPQISRSEKQQEMLQALASLPVLVEAVPPVLLKPLDCKEHDYEPRLSESIHVWLRRFNMISTFPLLELAEKPSHSSGQCASFFTPVHAWASQRKILSQVSRVLVLPPSELKSAADTTSA